MEDDAAPSGAHTETARVGATMIEELKKTYRQKGFAIVQRLLSDRVVEELQGEASRLLRESISRGGARNLLQRSDRLRTEGETGRCSKLARRILGPGARPVKLTLFNKTPSANWLIRWHQDLQITVRERREVDGFTAWSIKEGVLHVRPPVEVLRDVVALRVHLDPTPAENGALKVLPGSHRLGRLSREEIAGCRERVQEVVCEVDRGGVMLMSPLLLHSSSKASSPSNRRVLHFEYSARALPGGLEWA